ncbi:MAG TPA: hypothetical protein VIA06_01140 [Candidatus Dormibacteraeota bacterium]|nr:hypothetical protein [Candidatus Dormibacteraeota bacterium]
MYKPNSLTDSALDTAWGLWAELGVSSWVEPRSQAAIDVEPLILFTSWIGRHDNRLWEESLDWCAANHRWVSVVRLRRLFKDSAPDVAASFAEYGATVRRVTGIPNWPAGDVPRQIVLSHKSRPPRLGRPALLQLRIRAVLGPTARAEILRLLLIDRPQGWSAAEIADQISYTKANVASALEPLGAAGYMDREPEGSRFRYRLSRAQQLRDFVGPVPAFQPDWTARLAVMTELTRFDEKEPIEDGTAKAAELYGAIRRIQPMLHRLGLSPLVPRPGRPAFGEQLEGWMHGLLAYWAGRRSLPDTAGVRYHVGRTGTAWEASAEDPEWATIRPLNVPFGQKEPSGVRLAVGEGRSVAPSAPELANELFQQAFSRDGLQRASSRFQPEVHTFVGEELLTIPEGTIRIFDQLFLQFWWAEHVARVGGSAVT